MRTVFASCGNFLEGCGLLINWLVFKVLESASAAGGHVVADGFAFEKRLPSFAPFDRAARKPFAPLSGGFGGKAGDLFLEPAFGISAGLSVMVEAQDEAADNLIASSTLALNESANGCGFLVAFGIVLLQQFIQGFLGEQAGFLFREDRELRVEFELIEMLA